MLTPQENQLIEDGKTSPGSGASYIKFTEPDYRILQLFKNPGLGGEDVVTFICDDEITALCPLTGQPDFYSVEISYTPQESCIESKSAKLYLGAYRNERGFIETLATRILDDWVEACDPVYAEIKLQMKPRGGIAIRVTKSFIHDEA